VLAREGGKFRRLCSLETDDVGVVGEKDLKSCQSETGGSACFEEGEGKVSRRAQERETAGTVPVRRTVGLGKAIVVTWGERTNTNSRFFTWREQLPISTSLPHSLLLSDSL
jgi:hypothetical protein